MIEQLREIWQRLLARPSLGVHENFFELGGTPAIAIELFAEIARAYSQELPPMMIYQAPTIAALASLLEQPGKPHFSPLVLLKSGSEHPPIFIASGLGASFMELFQVLKHMELPHPIYGLQARGVDGVSAPLAHIEDMAQMYLEAIRDTQPEGPYLFIGYSIGGMVVLEIAQRLLKKGLDVGLLVMIDSYPHSSRLTPRVRLRLLKRLAARRASAALRLAIPGRRRHVEKRSVEALYRAPAGAAFAPSIRRVRDQAYVAWKRYRPAFYNGGIKFVRANVSSNFPDDAVSVWAHLAREFEVESVPGDHLELLTTHYEDLATALMGHLRGALTRQMTVQSF